MAKTLGISNNNGDSIKVGTKGTVITLMNQELESSKHKASQAYILHFSEKNTDYCSFSILRFHPRKPSQKKNTSSEATAGISSCSKSNTKNNARRNGQVPMLASEDITMDRNPSRKNKDKKRQSYIAESVDVKCSNPMSRRLKKLGFSKLSKSFA